MKRSAERNCSTDRLIDTGFIDTVALSLRERLRRSTLTPLEFRGDLRHGSLSLSLKRLRFLFDELPEQRVLGHPSESDKIVVLTRHKWRPFVRQNRTVDFLWDTATVLCKPQLDALPHVSDLSARGRVRSQLHGARFHHCLLGSRFPPDKIIFRASKNATGCERCCRATSVAYFHLHVVKCFLNKERRIAEVRGVYCPDDDRHTTGVIVLL